MPTINLIARDNGAGLSGDIRLLSRTLQAAGFEVTITRLGHRGRLVNRLRRAGARLRRLAGHWRRGVRDARYDINLMLERIRPELFHQARHQVLIPNPEWFADNQHAHLPAMALVLAKTRHGEQLFRGLGCLTRYIGFSTDDHRAGFEAQAEAMFLHAPGASENKGTRRLLQLWARHPHWPTLTLLWRPRDDAPATVPPNVCWVRSFLAPDDLLALQNNHRFHLCPSQTEGYGHFIAEAMSVGAVVVATDAEPMNELVARERGLLVAAHAAGRQDLATLYDFDDAAMVEAIERCIAMGNMECARLGENARHWYERNARDFGARLADALQGIPVAGPAPSMAYP
jgi:hypothetical protein